MINVLELIAMFVQAWQEKWGYIWGTAGIMWTEARQKALEKTTDANRAKGRKYGKKWIGRMVADCSGLFRWAFRKLGSDIHHGSDTIYRKYTTNKGVLLKGKRSDGRFLKPGTAVFCYNEEKKNYSHIGLYIGDGWVIEAAGTIDGVIRSKITNSKWEFWGELKGVDYSAVAVDEPEPQPVTDPVLRKGCKGSDVKDLQKRLIALGYDLGKWGADGDYGSQTEKAVREFQKVNGLSVDGIAGQEVWSKLKTDPAPLPVVTYTVTITGLLKAAVDELTKKYPSAVVQEVV